MRGCKVRATGRRPAHGAAPHCYTRRAAHLVQRRAARHAPRPIEGHDLMAPAQLA